MFIPDKRKEGNGAKREGRMFQILTALYEEEMQPPDARETGRGLTSVQIANMIGLSPSWYVRDMLAEMAASGWIDCWTRDKANGAVAYVWQIEKGVEFSEKWKDAFIAWYPALQQRLPMGEE